MSAQCAPGEKEIENFERSFVFMKAALVIMAAGMGSRYGAISRWTASVRTVKF